MADEIDQAVSESLGAGSREASAQALRQVLARIEMIFEDFAQDIAQAKSELRDQWAQHESQFGPEPAGWMRDEILMILSLGKAENA